MRRDHFVNLLETEMRTTEKAAMKLSLGDALGLARLQGVYTGLQTALTKYNDAIKQDPDAD